LLLRVTVGGLLVVGRMDWLELGPFFCLLAQRREMDKRVRESLGCVWREWMEQQMVNE
jgi:hypothetical protein